MKIPTKSLAIAAALAGGAALSACTDYGPGGYGYSGVSVGYNASWGDPYWGWYGDYYYPGTGIYVYDSHRNRHRWNDGQRRYWEGRRDGWRGDRNWRSNWDRFDRRGHRDGRRGGRHRRGN